MNAGELDAFFTPLQAPALALHHLLASRKATLVPLTPEVQSVMPKRHGTHRSATLDPHTYPSQPDPVDTLSVTATLMLRADLPDNRVHEILDQLFQSAAKLARHKLRSTLLTRQSAHEGVLIPLHPAAENYFSSTGGSATR
jgi:TRAP-type uncharacterized transport system substrate-binding protein